MGELAGNSHILVITVLMLVAFLYAVYVITAIVKRRTKVRDANKEISLIKMDLISKQAHLQNLIEDSIEWTDKDLREYDMTLDDTRLLKGKLDKGMDVADVRTKRLEMGNQTHEMFETMEKIKRYEDKLFGEDAVNGRKR